MDGATQPSDVGPEGGDPTDAADIVLPSISRRRFATVAVGAGSLAIAGGALAGPRISTIRFGQKAQVGSAPPGSTSSTSTTIAGQTGSITVSSSSPCAGEDLTVTASGFAPKTAVTLEIDSAATTLGVTTCDAKGQINTIVKLPANGPTGEHTLVLVGVAPGGRTITLTKSITIKTVEECAVGPEGTTSTTTPGNPNVSTSTPTSTTPTTTPTTTPVTTAGNKPPTRTGSGLAFTGTDTTQLALLGAAAAIAGRMLYGVAAGRGADEDDDDDDGPE